MSNEDLLSEISLLESFEKRKENLPHLYAKKHYKWSRAFYESRAKINLLCAANQIGKSSVLQRKFIHWATETSLWSELWPTKPTMFWYFYPTKALATSEFENKWVKEWLPRNEMKEDVKYGWKEHYDKEGDIDYIEFNSGVNLYFKSYATSPTSLQAGSVYAMGCDEELPYTHYDELMMRMSSPSIDGYFHMAFTATLGQYFWYRAIERVGKRDEELKQAFKIQVSMYDCLQYEDGSPGPYTVEYIEELKAKLPEMEQQRRIYGRFVISNEDRKYFAFDRSRHLVDAHPVPKNWHVYVGVDIGSGGKGGKKGSHPPAIAFTAVKPDYTKGRVFKIWIPHHSETFTAPDVYYKYKNLCKELNVTPTGCFYDWGSKDFKTTAIRDGAYVEMAEKGEYGVDIMNTLLKYDQCKIYNDEDGCAEVTASQLENVKKDTPKQNADDDGADAVRYSWSKVPWNFVNLSGETSKREVVEEEVNDRERKRRDHQKTILDKAEDGFNAEFDEWNHHYGS